MILEEFDKNKNAILNPEVFSKKIDNCPELCISFISKYVMEDFIKEFNPEVIGKAENETCIFPLYKIIYHGKPIAVYHSPLGAPACVSIFDEMIIKGIKKLLLVGCCGCLDKKLEDYSIIIPTSAIRDEGTSYHYAPAEDEVTLNPISIAKIENQLQKLGIHYNKGKTWTTDGFYRETPEKLKRRKDQGAITVDMECSAMAVAANFRNIEFAQIFYAADNLAEEEYQPRSMLSKDISCKNKIIPIALDCVLALE